MFGGVNAGIAANKAADRIGVRDRELVGERSMLSKGGKHRAQDNNRNTAVISSTGVFTRKFMNTYLLASDLIFIGVRLFWSFASTISRKSRCLSK